MYCAHSSLQAMQVVWITGSYSRGTVREATCFLGTFEIPKDFMEKSAKLYFGKDRKFKFPEKLDFKLFLV